jgi:hypothetical protein
MSGGVFEHPIHVSILLVTRDIFKTYVFVVRYTTLRGAHVRSWKSTNRTQDMSTHA